MFIQKVIVSGSYLEIYDYQKPVLENYERKPRNENQKPKEQGERRTYSIVRTRNTIRRLINVNFQSYQKVKFITLTFKKPVKDIAKANNYFKFFLRRLKRFLNKPNLKYISIIEFQTSGRVHFHILAECKYIENKVLNKIWGKGFVNIRGYSDIKSVRNIGAYICKYLTKETLDQRFNGQKAYQCSRGLKQPIEYKGKLAKLILENCDKKLIYEKEFENEYRGKVMYKQYHYKN